MDKPNTILLQPGEITEVVDGDAILGLQNRGMYRIWYSWLPNGSDPAKTDIKYFIGPNSPQGMPIGIQLDAGDTLYAYAEAPIPCVLTY